jgi:hypothetical protein
MNRIYEIVIASPPDREKLVAMISFKVDELAEFDSVQWAEINQESDVLQIEFYPRPDGKPWRIDAQTAIDALIEARHRLIS